MKIESDREEKKAGYGTKSYKERDIDVGWRPKEVRR